MHFIEILYNHFSHAMLWTRKERKQKKIDEQRYGKYILDIFQKKVFYDISVRNHRIYYRIKDLKLSTTQTT